MRRTAVFFAAADRLTVEAVVRFLVATTFLVVFCGAAFALAEVAFDATGFFDATRLAAGLAGALTVRFGAVLVLRVTDLVDEALVFLGAAARLAGVLTLVFWVLALRALVLLATVLRDLAF